MNIINTIGIIAGLGLSSLSIVSCATGTTTSASDVKPYTKDVCIVTDNKLGSMGDPVTLVHNGQEVKFCCKPCVKKFQDNPEKYLARL